MSANTWMRPKASRHLQLAIKVPSKCYKRLSACAQRTTAKLSFSSSAGSWRKRLREKKKRRAGAFCGRSTNNLSAVIFRLRPIIAQQPALQRLFETAWASSVLSRPSLMPVNDCLAAPSTEKLRLFTHTVRWKEDRLRPTVIRISVSRLRDFMPVL